MTDTVWITLIIAVALVIILIVFRDKLSKFSLKAKGLDTKMETHAPPSSSGINVSSNVMEGKKQGIETSGGNINVKNNIMKGEEQKIKAGDSKK